MIHFLLIAIPSALIGAAFLSGIGRKLKSLISKEDAELKTKLLGYADALEAKSEHMQAASIITSLYHKL